MFNKKVESKKSWSGYIQRFFLSSRRRNSLLVLLFACCLFPLTACFPSEDESLVLTAPSIVQYSQTFPRDSCGDKLPSNSSEYPLSYYPVHIPNTGDNLQVVKEKFCKDAFIKKIEGTGEDVIQIASFYTDNSSDFLSLMEESFDGVKLGKAKVIEEPL